ncbi:gamma-glutamyltransferase [Sinorhizobium meliloti]|uniref:gamma-glutamyltransferase n=1 Tax=Rhizobium meliloti TaxID=382 RepID=UPI00398D20A1
MSKWNAMISAPQPQAVEAGAEVLKIGGNAVDAAIACAFVQTVVDPSMCGIAGFGSFGIYLPQIDHHGYIDFHAPAPLATRPDMWAGLIESEARDGFGFFLKGRVNEVGYESVAVPATLRALEFAHKRFGTLPWDVLIEPAIYWADNGWTVRRHVYEFWTEPSILGRISGAERLAATAASRALFCRPDGKPKEVGETVVNRDYAEVLRQIAKHGAQIFYNGEIADRIAEDFAQNGGLLTRKDLEIYQPKERLPVWSDYRGWKVSTNHPPGGGVMYAQMLNVLEHFDLRELGHNTPEYIAVVAETMKRATSDKERFIVDPDFIPVPIDRLLSKELAKDRAKAIAGGEIAHVTRFDASIPTKNTTHLSVVDANGGCVSMTHSLGAPSGVVTDGLGFQYNGCMGIFDPRPGRPGSLAPGKARFSSMCPSIIFKDGTPELVIGAPGATQIAMGVLQVTLNSLDFGMTMTEAVSAPRFAATSDIIDISQRIPYGTQQALEAKGYEVARSPHPFGFSGVHAIRISNGALDGGADPWLDGMALGVGKHGFH